MVGYAENRLNRVLGDNSIKKSLNLTSQASEPLTAEDRLRAEREGALADGEWQISLLGRWGDDVIHYISTREHDDVY